jgi:uncharacterized protein YdeI (YjbR/CyaY-like superfamily)
MAGTDAMPEDLEAALAVAPAARAAYDKLPPSHRGEYHKWINEAKREATRAERVRRTVEMLTEGRPWRRG